MYDLVTKYNFVSQQKMLTLFWDSRDLAFLILFLAASRSSRFTSRIFRSNWFRKVAIRKREKISNSNDYKLITRKAFRSKSLHCDLQIAFGKQHPPWSFVYPRWGTWSEAVRIVRSLARRTASLICPTAADFCPPWWAPDRRSCANRTPGHFRSCRCPAAPGFVFGPASCPASLAHSRSSGCSGSAPERSSYCSRSSSCTVWFYHISRRALRTPGLVRFCHWKYREGFSFCWHLWAWG